MKLTPVKLARLGGRGSGKTYAGAQAAGIQLAGGGSVVLADSGPHSLVLETEMEDVVAYGSLHRQRIPMSTTVKCGCGWQGTWATSAEAWSNAQDHLGERIERSLADVPFTPREVEDARVINGTIENLLAAD